VQRRRGEREDRRLRERDAVQRHDLRRALEQPRRLSAEHGSGVGIAVAAADEDLVADRDAFGGGADRDHAARRLVTGNDRIAETGMRGNLPPKSIRSVPAEIDE